MNKYSKSDARTVISNIKKNDLNTLHLLFSGGSLPVFEEIKGETAGGFLAWNNANPRLMKFSAKILFNSFIGRWTGKKFLSPFDANNRGIGINLFRSRILSNRFPFDTYVKNARSDQKPCLALDYSPYPSLMSGLIDDVRKIDDGVFLGQMHYKFPWKKELWFLGYFVLCALQD